MKIQTLYVRIMPADKDRGYILMAGYDGKLVQTSCATYTTLSVLTRESLTAAIERMRVSFDAVEIRDVTAPALLRKLQKMFGEPVTPLPAKPKKVKDED